MRLRGYSRIGQLGLAEQLYPVCLITVRKNVSLVSGQLTEFRVPDPGNARRLILQPLSDYKTSLRAFHEASIQTQCIEFAASTRKKWWYYLPAIGYSFGLPNISGAPVHFNKRAY